jgi:D-alanine-D-alanine ligase
MTTHLRVALIYGGKSGEHEVSLLTAQSVIEAIDRGKYDVYLIYISQDGRWKKQPLPVSGPMSIEALRLPDEEASVAFPDFSPYDVVFPLLHGPNGEDGTVQGLLELANLPYVGCGVLSSAVSMDKIIAKTILNRHGIPQVPYVSALRPDWEENPQEVMATIEESLAYPCFVKPANLGSSVGISKASDRPALQSALSLAFRFDRKVIIEAFVDAREIEVAVLGNNQPEASIPGEIITSNEFYDYQAKYQDGATRLIIPADLDEQTTRQIRQIAVQVFKAVDGSGLARVDFFLEKKTNRIIVSEINTMPGFTKFSMYPLLWQASGLTYPELIDRLIDLAVDRYEEKKKNIIAFN